MHRSLSLSLFAGLALAPTFLHVQPASAQQPGAPAQASGLVERGPGIERFFRIRTPGAAVIDPSGDLWVRDWPQGVFQLYRVEGTGSGLPSAGPGRDATQMTNFPDGLSGYSLSDDGSKLLVFTNAGGNERTQVYLLDQRDWDLQTNITPVLVNPQVVHSVQLWLHDSNGFIFTANEQSPEDFHIYRFDFDGRTEGAVGTKTPLLRAKGSWGASDITRDGTRLLVGQFRSASDSTMQELDARTGELRDLHSRVLGDGATASIGAVGYLPGESSILFVSDHEQDGITRLYRMDLASGAVTKPLPQLDRYELDGASLDTDRAFLTVQTNEDGYGVMHIFRVSQSGEGTFEPVALPDLPRGLVTARSIRDGRLIYGVNNDNIPGLTFAYDLPAPGAQPGTPTQITFADDQGIDLAGLSQAQLITYKAQDGLEIPAFLYLPEGFKKGDPIPFVVDFHGGPEGQHRPSFDVQTQYLLSEGFGVLAPNVRGSTGYGREFQMMDNYKNRWRSVQDGVDAAKWLVEQGYAQPGMIAGWGGSYGGYMATATLVEDSERTDAGLQERNLFGAAINVVGIVNMRTFLENTAGYRRALREAEYGPLSDPQFLDSVSPLLRQEKIRVPMMLAHGLNDPRVPIGEAIQLAEALQRRGIDPEQVYFHDEGHGFAKLENRLLYMQRAARFLRRSLHASDQ